MSFAQPSIELTCLKKTNQCHKLRIPCYGPEAAYGVRAAFEESTAVIRTQTKMVVHGRVATALPTRRHTHRHPLVSHLSSITCKIPEILVESGLSSLQRSDGGNETYREIFYAQNSSREVAPNVRNMNLLSEGKQGGSDTECVMTRSYKYDTVLSKHF